MNIFRVAAYPLSGAPTTIGALTVFEADYILDLFQAGAYCDPSKYQHIHVEIACPRHGWQQIDAGVCGECLDEHFYPPD